jgi:hypothetical protein
MKIPPTLHSEGGGQRDVAVSAWFAREALIELAGRHPALEGRIFEGGPLPTFLNVFVDKRSPFRSAQTRIGARRPSSLAPQLSAWL